MKISLINHNTPQYKTITNNNLKKDYNTTNNSTNLNNLPHYRITFQAKYPYKKVNNDIALNQILIDKLKIKNLRKLDNNNISGPTFATRPDSDLISLKKAGIKRIIDFRAEAEQSFMKKCKSLNLEYFNFPLDHYGRLKDSPYFESINENKTVVSDKFVKNLNKFINMSNDGNAYMGCYYGVDRTNMGVLFDYIFSNKEKSTPKLLHWAEASKKSVVNKDLKIIRKIARRLTPEQKNILNLDDKFKENLDKKINKILITNIYSPIE